MDRRVRSYIAVTIVAIAGAWATQAAATADPVLQIAVKPGNGSLQRGEVQRRAVQNEDRARKAMPSRLLLV
jgi:hypothetical protein